MFAGFLRYCDQAGGTYLADIDGPQPRSGQ